MVNYTEAGRLSQAAEGCSSSTTGMRRERWSALVVAAPAAGKTLAHQRGLAVEWSFQLAHHGLEGRKTHSDGQRCNEFLQALIPASDGVAPQGGQVDGHASAIVWDRLTLD